MAPTGVEHGDLESEIAYHLKGFVRQRQQGRVVTGEVGIFIRRDPDRIRAADIAFFTHEQLAGIRPKGYATVAPELIVEIISPGDSWMDIRAKLQDYFSIGVSCVWIVEPNSRTVLIYRSATEFQELAETDTLTGEGTLHGFSLPVADIFA